VTGKTCRVSFTDLAGIRHRGEIQADSLYEAAIVGLKALKKAEWIDAVGPATRLEIQVLEPAAVHILLVAQLTRWLDGGSKNPAEAITKKRLKQLLAS
jgi:hypothetical protein